MLSVHTAFSYRASALLTVQTLMSDLASLQSRIEKLEAASSKVFGGDRTRLRKVEELRETIRATEDAKCCALREYERIKVTGMHFIKDKLMDAFITSNEHDKASGCASITTTFS
jgi:hypothetical protein